ncbi:hypothetical protein Tco_1534597, partial [Tanacetum coccineum]
CTVEILSFIQLTRDNTSLLVILNMDNDDNDSKNDVKEDNNETTSFMTSKSSTGTHSSKNKGGIGSKSLYERWKDDYDDNSYDVDVESEDTEEQLSLCYTFVISVHGQIRR